jgi:hypothetical protein
MFAEYAPSWMYDLAISTTCGVIYAMIEFDKASGPGALFFAKISLIAFTLAVL